MEERKFQVLPGAGAITKCWVDGVSFEEEAKDQIINVSKLPFVKRIAVMPDVHAGKGATIGSVIATKKAIVPAALGVDIGCGMQAVRTTLTASDLPDNLGELRTAIEKRIPHGRTNNGGPGDRGAWDSFPLHVGRSWIDLAKDYENIIAKHPKIKPHTDPVKHLGTLGTGNHFVEVCLDEDQKVWIMLHSGSRGIGNKIGSYFIEKAQEEMLRWHITLSDKDLAYLPEGTEIFNDYMQTVSWAQSFALKNRDAMMLSAIDAMESVIKKPFTCDCGAINCHHNYVATENHFGENLLVTRKGATRARAGDLGIIPGSMGAKSYIVEGLGNKDALCSCSHGAGRKMSRNAAKKVITLEDHKRATEGVECRKDSEVLDESPACYKDVDAVMAAQSDLVKIRHTLKQIVCIKG